MGVTMTRLVDAAAAGRKQQQLRLGGERLPRTAVPPPSGPRCGLHPHSTHLTMKTLLRLVYFSVLYGLLSIFSPAATDKPGSPYFQIPGDRDETSQETMPLKSSAAKIRIEGTIARIHLTQTYANHGKSPIEALYIFPASTRAAIHGMTLTSGGRVIAARHL